MKKTVYRKATVYIKQDVEYGSEAELEDALKELECRITLDVDSMQDGGCSEYDYHLGDIDEVDESDFPHWLFK